MQRPNSVLLPDDFLSPQQDDKRRRSLLRSRASGLAGNERGNSHLRCIWAQLEGFICYHGCHFPEPGKGPNTCLPEHPRHTAAKARAGCTGQRRARFFFCFAMLSYQTSVTAVRDSGPFVCMHFPPNLCPPPRLLPSPTGTNWQPGPSAEAYLTTFSWQFLPPPVLHVQVPRLTKGASAEGRRHWSCLHAAGPNPAAA